MARGMSRRWYRLIKATIINEIALAIRGASSAGWVERRLSRCSGVLGVESKATDGVDGRLDEDGGSQRASGDGEEGREVF